MRINFRYEGAGTLQAPMATPFQMSIRRWLLLLALVAGLPLFVFSTYTVVALGRAQQDAIRAELLQRTEATANAVRERLATTTGSLVSIAASDEALRDDLPGLYEHARRVVQQNPDAAAVTLIGPDLRMVFHTMVPLGAPTFPTNRPEAARKVFETGRPVASGPFVGPVTGKVVTVVGVPVFRGGKVAYCLRMVLRSESLNELLAGQALPPEWTAAVTDAEGTLVARTRAPDLYVGQPAAAAVLEALRAGRRGIFDGRIKEGTPSRLAMVDVPGWDWKVAIAVPTATLNAPFYRSLAALVASGVLFTMLAALAARWLSLRIIRQVRDVAAASRALQQGRRLPRPSVDIRELDQMGEALSAVDVRERQTRLALDSMIARHREVSGELMRARRDALTGLPGRALFHDGVEEARRLIGEDPAQQLALLFIDLDGFKHLNDSLGHEQGDQVLLQVALVLKEITRETDIAARIGGDEFAVCVAAPRDAIGGIAESVAIRIVNRVAEIGHGISCSVGIALWPDGCGDLASVMKRADAAMYEAKRLGKNRHAFFRGEAQVL